MKVMTLLTSYPFAPVDDTGMQDHHPKFLILMTLSRHIRQIIGWHPNLGLVSHVFYEWGGGGGYSVGCHQHLVPCPFLGVAPVLLRVLPRGRYSSYVIGPAQGYHRTGVLLARTVVPLAFNWGTSS